MKNIIAATVYAALCFFLLVSSVQAIIAQPSTVDLTIHNSYRFDVQLEVKCDWSQKKRAFLYHEKLRVPGWKKTVLKVPNHHKKCEVWPHIKLF